MIAHHSQAVHRPQPGVSSVCRKHAAQHHLPRPRKRARLHLAVRATSQDEPSDFNIDDLAQQLSSEANRMRSSLGGSEDQLDLAASLDQEALQGSQSLPPTGSQLELQGQLGSDSLLEQLGDGGFDAEEFQLQQLLGQLNFVTQQELSNPLQVARRSPSQAAVLAYLALYSSLQAYEVPVTVLLKEYLPGTHGVAVNEIRMMGALHGIPGFGEKWRAANDMDPKQPPIVPLLGHFISAPSPTGREMSGLSASSSGQDSEQEGAAVWLVYKWEALQPLAGYPAAGQTKPPSAFRLFKWGAGGGTPPGQTASQAERCRMLRAIMRGALQAMTYCHGRGIAHGALGPSSLLLSTYEDHRADQLVVRLDNFGFARRSVPGQDSWEGGIRGHSTEGYQGDLQALGLTLLETVMAALSSEGSWDKVQHEALQRLVCTVFRRDMEPFRKYCLQEPAWSRAVQFLDEQDRAGWDLFSQLIAGRTSARDLCGNSFCAA